MVMLINGQCFGRRFAEKRLITIIGQHGWHAALTADMTVMQTDDIIGIGHDNMQVV